VENELSQVRSDTRTELDSVIKEKMNDMRDRGMRISMLEASVRSLTVDLERTNLLLEQSRKNEEAAVKRATELHVTIE
jgi:hypothetical protein